MSADFVSLYPSTMKSVQFFIDTSGSTHGQKTYYDRAAEEYKKETAGISVDSIEVYEWAKDCRSMKIWEFVTVVDTRCNLRVGAGGTMLSSICAHLKPSASDIIIVTDGDIQDFEEATSLLKLFVKSIGTHAAPRIRLVIEGDCKNNIVLALASADIGVEISVNKEPTIAYAPLPDINAFLASIDLEKYYNDAEYKKEIDLAVRCNTVNKTSDFILAAKLEISKLRSKVCKLTDTKDVDIEAMITRAALSNDENALQEIGQKLAGASLAQVHKLDVSLSRIEAIVDKYLDFDTLYIPQQVTDGSDVPAPVTSEVDAEQLPAGMIECFFTSQVGTPYLAFIPEEPVTVTKPFLKQLVSNPLLILTACKLETACGSFFINHPSRFQDGRDPKTRKNLFDRDGTALVLPLGPSDEHIEYANKILFRTLFSDYMVADMDIVFMALWHAIKYKTKRLDLIENLGTFEAQLRARFDKPDTLSLGSNTSERGSAFRAKKWMCVWFVVHELAFFSQHDQRHSSTVRFLSHIHVMIDFLQDIYGVNVRSDVKSYLRDYLALKQLIRCHNTTDPDQFWRAIRAIKTESYRASVSSSDDQVIKITKSVTFGKTISIETHSNVVKKDDYVIIPLDVSRSTPYPFSARFPPSCLDQHKLARLSCFVLSDKFMFNNPGENEALRQQTIAKIGFDPERFEPYWSANISLMPLDEAILRPFGRENWKASAQQLIGENAPFVSCFHHLAKFIVRKGAYPTRDEFIVFVDRLERSAQNEHVFVRGQLVSRVRTERVSTLPVNFHETIGLILGQVLAFKLEPAEALKRLSVPY